MVTFKMGSVGTSDSPWHPAKGTVQGKEMPFASCCQQIRPHGGVC